MSRPRTREHFPRMKVRGGRRRLRAHVRQAWRDVAVSASKVGTAFVRIVVDTTAFTEAMVRVSRHVRVAAQVGFWLARRRARDQWLSRRMLTATPSPWAAPIREEAH